MGMIDTIQESGESRPADPLDDTVINGAPYDARQTIQGGTEKKPAAPADGPDPQIAEEIKRQQILLAVRYVAAVRGR
jgi:hypothetical protein